MKVESLTFNQLALELYRDNLITEKDHARLTRSLEAKGTGFIADLDELAQCVRTGLATGVFRLTERLNCVFERPSKSKRLPVFLGVMLNKVFSPWGELLDDYCTYTAATVIQLCSALKRTDPEPDQVPILESEVWSKLRSNFGDEERVMQDIVTRCSTDPTFRHLFFRARDHFRRLVDLPLEANFAYGPGKNRDRYAAMTGMDWYCADAFEWHDVPPEPFKSWVTEVAKQFNHQPFENTPIGRYPISIGQAIMNCSAQPKSYKAYRGVGVTSAFRMALQLSLQRTFYARGLNENLPLRDQEEMRRNLSENWDRIGTIDLSSASDRCYWSILHYFGHGIPWFDACYRYRTRTLILPDGSIRCASPVMGEAITFPLMSAYFLSLAYAVSDLTGSDKSLIRVYGDDIQCTDYELLMEFLRNMGSLPSASKSYPPESYFKESCEAHYVISDKRQLRNARPAYIPSGKLVPRRKRISHADVFKLLILAKDAYLRFGHLAKAACRVIEQYSSFTTLPSVPFSSPFLGRPTMTGVASFAHLSVVMSPDETHEISERGYRRILLRSPEYGPDEKLLKKQQYKILSKKVVRLVINDDFADLKDEIFILALRRNFPALCAHNELFGKSRKHIAGVARSLLTDVMISHEISLLIEQLRAVEI